MSRGLKPERALCDDYGARDVATFFPAQSGTSGTKSPRRSVRRTPKRSSDIVSGSARNSRGSGEVSALAPSVLVVVNAGSGTLADEAERARLRTLLHDAGLQPAIVEVTGGES